MHLSYFGFSVKIGSFFRGVNLFAFVAPLSIYVWVLMLLALALVSVAMYAIAKLSPYETEDLGRRILLQDFLNFYL